MEDFEKRLAEIKELIEQEQYPKLMRAYFHLLGQRDSGKAVPKTLSTIFEGARAAAFSDGQEQRRHRQCSIFLFIGRCLRSVRDVEPSTGCLQENPPYWEQRFNSGDIYAKTFYRAGKLYELCSGWSGKTKIKSKTTEPNPSRISGNS